MASLWDSDEMLAFKSSVIGQITPTTVDGMAIVAFLQDTCIKTILEIGTWNGMGSTLCILAGIADRPDIEFWSLECNKEKADAAKENLKPYLNPRIHLLYGTIVKPQDILSDTEYLDNFDGNIVQRYLLADLDNCEKAPNVLDNLPEIIDFLVLDGGEYTTLYEFQLLFSRCSQYIVLDDTSTPKCMSIRNTLKADPLWQEVYYSSERNGFSIFKRLLKSH
jgi:hypothetical protein